MVASVAARKAEIARRYRGQEARKRGERVHLAPIRVTQLCRHVSARYGQILPDDDAGRADARITAHHLAMLTGDQRRRIAPWMKSLGPVDGAR